MSKKLLFLVIGNGLLMSAGFNVSAQTTWHCIARDAEGQKWVSSSSYKRTALNSAYDACKKASKTSSTCKITAGDCDSYFDGISTRPQWQCTALDQLAMVWKSDTYRHADDASLAAKSFCADRSALPETCFTSLLFCKNLNPLD